MTPREISHGTAASEPQRVRRSKKKFSMTLEMSFSERKPGVRAGFKKYMCIYLFGWAGS